MMKKILVATLCFFLLGSLSLNAQEYNQKDSKGRRQGPWMGYYPDGQKRYEGQFKNDKCQGVFTYYQENGALWATNTFDKSGTKALNKTYAPNGTLIATGYYLNQEKEGEWRFYSEETGALLTVEEYKGGLAHGPSKTYFETGVLMSERLYVKDRLEGPAKNYYPSGALKEEGQFHNDKRSGIWKTYNEDGDVVSTENYDAPEIQGFER